MILASTLLICNVIVGEDGGGDSHDLIPNSNLPPAFLGTVFDFRVRVKVKDAGNVQLPELGDALDGDFGGVSRSVENTLPNDLVGATGNRVTPTITKVVKTIYVDEGRRWEMADSSRDLGLRLCVGAASIKSRLDHGAGLFEVSCAASWSLF